MNDKLDRATMYNVGDKLKLTLTRENGSVSSVFHTEVLSLRAPDFVFVRGPLKGDYALADFTKNGWIVAEHTLAGHPLPQVDGLYQVKGAPHMIYQRLDGRWFFYRTARTVIESDLTKHEFLRLRPEAEVAAEIADWMDSQGYIIQPALIREKWGVK